MKNMNCKKILSLALVAVFLLLCLVPSVGMLLFGESKAGANEILSSRPSLTNKDGGLNTGYLSEFADYIADRFYLRQELITAWNKLNTSLLGTSPSDSVVYGSNGWLYYADTLADYTNSDPMTDREIYSAARTLYILQQYAQDKGCEFLFTIAPNKNSLYSDNMPSLPVLDGEKNSSRLAAALQEMGVDYADMFSAFSSKDEVLYYRTDSHWNGKGAALAADTLLTALGRDSALYTSPFASADAHKGDLYEMLYPAGNETEEDSAPAAGYTFTYTRAFRAPTDLLILTAQENGTGNLVMFRDSFGNNLYANMAEAFATAAFSRANAYDMRLLDTYSADTLIIELVERNLRYLLQYVPVCPAPEADITPDAVKEGESITLTVEDSNLEGYSLVSAAFCEAPDDNSPVYLCSGDTVWEAFPTEDGFAAHIPTEYAGNTLSAVYSCGGSFMSVPFVVK